MCRAVLLPDYLIDKAIHDGEVVVNPLDRALIQPASLDVRLGSSFRIFKQARHSLIDVKRPVEDLMEASEHSPEDPFILHPGAFVLATTLESIALPPDIAAALSGKSSLGRLGLQVHATAGWIDPGFHGMITLELSNVAPLPITLYPYMPIGQLAFQRLSEPCRRPYDGKYNGQHDATASRMHRNFEVVAERPQMDDRN